MALAPSCTPRYAQVRSSGLTALQIRGLTPNEIENLANKEIDLLRVILQAAEAKALGAEERGLGILLRSAVKNIKPKLNTTKIDEQSIVLPYFMRTQPAAINANYFTIEGATQVGAGSGGVPANASQFTLNLGSSFLKTDLEAIERYFVPGMSLFVMTWNDTTTKTAVNLHFTVHSAANADSGGTKKATVWAVPNISTTAFAALSSPQKAAYAPTFGVAQIGSNNVSDREAYCQNQPSNLSKKLIVNWLQTSRESRVDDDYHKGILERILTGKVNDYQRNFVQMPLAKQWKEQSMQWEKAWYNSVFFNQKINEKQAPETYDELPTVADVFDPAVPLEYKANAIGILQMLQDCNRVIDFNGNPLDLDTIFDELRKIKRFRDQDGDSVSVIDSMTDRVTSSRILEAMIRFYKVKYGMETQRYYQLGQTIKHEGIVLFNYHLFDLPEHGFQWSVFWDSFFDDLLAATPATVSGQDFKARARMLWFIDWSDITTGIAGTKNVIRKNPDPSVAAEYKCVITPNQKTFNLRSTRWTVLIDRPERHLVVVNFAGTCPLIAAAACDAPNP